MEAWRLLAGLAAMLVVYAALTSVTGYDPSPGEVLVAVLLGAAGLYGGHVLARRLFPEED